MNNAPDQNSSPAATPEAPAVPGQWSGFGAEFAKRMQAYISQQPDGFEQLQWAITLLEIERDPVTGEPKLTADGKFSYPLADAKQKILFERFLSWQRCWFLWPVLEHEINASDKYTPQQKREALDAISRVRALLRELGPQPAAVC